MVEAEAEAEVEGDSRDSRTRQAHGPYAYCDKSSIIPIITCIMKANLYPGRLVQLGSYPLPCLVGTASHLLLVANLISLPVL